LVVPASVVQQGPEGAFAFVINDDQTAKMQPVKVASIDNGVALIDEGLQAGQRVVVDGQYKLQNGSKVQVGPPAGSPAASRDAAGGKPGKSKGDPGNLRNSKPGAGRTNAEAQ
jgi:multidrug efflux system membrane fusion protein